MPPDIEIFDELSSSRRKFDNKEQKELFDKQKAKLLHGLFIWGLRIAALCIAVLFVVRIIHYVFPVWWYWLSEEQIQSLDRFLFSGAVGAVTTRYFKDIVDFKK